MLAIPRRLMIGGPWAVPIALVALSLFAAPYLPHEWWLPETSGSASVVGGAETQLPDLGTVASDDGPTEIATDMQTDDLGMLLLVDEESNYPHLTWAPWPEQANQERRRPRLMLLRSRDLGWGRERYGEEFAASVTGAIAAPGSDVRAPNNPSNSANPDRDTQQPAPAVVDEPAPLLVAVLAFPAAWWAWRRRRIGKT